jgi:hypothetical protein
LAGRSDLTEIAAICAMETGMKVVAVVFPHADAPQFIGYPAVSSFALVAAEFDAVIVTDLDNTGETAAEAIERYGPKRVLVPNLLRGRMVKSGEAGQ